MTYFTLTLLEKRPDLLKVLLMETFTKNKYYKVQKPMIRTKLSSRIRCHSRVNARKQHASLSFCGICEAIAKV